MNTIEPTLKTSISMVDEAKVLWDDLKLQVLAGNGPRISELRDDIANCRQNGDSMMVYYVNSRRCEMNWQFTSQSDLVAVENLHHNWRKIKTKKELTHF